MPTSPNTAVRPLAALLCVAALLAGVLVGPATAATGQTEASDQAADRPGDWPTDALPGRLIVTLSPAAEPDAPEAEARAVGGSVRSLGGTLRLVTVPEGRERDAADRLLAVPGVRAVEPDRMRPWADVPDEPDDPLFARQWSHEQVRIASAWERSVGSRSVRVAVIDSGVHGGHPDLAANVVEQVDLSNGTPVPQPLGSDNDSCGIGHGTQVAGVLGAAGDNGIGIAGAVWRVGIVDLAVSSEATEGSCRGAADSAVLSALHYAAFNPGGAVDVVNLSIGGRQAWCPEAYAEAVARARERGVVVVAAAGNSGPGTAQVPASCPGVVAVAATGPDGLRAPYSAANPWVDIAAPGGTDKAGSSGLVVTLDPERESAQRQGTSFAAPYVSGVVALLRSLRADLSPDDIESLLERSAERSGTSGHSDDLGWGRLRADNAVSYAMRRQVIPAPEPDPWFPVLRLHDLPEGPGPLRIAFPAAERTDPVHQAVAVSQVVFRHGGAVHAVLARADDFPDALAGSALGMGVGPLLFNPPGDQLHVQNRRELRRALPPGATVYVLGGRQGIGPLVEAQLVAMDYEVTRLSGETREGTAARVAREIHRIRRRAGLGPVPEVLLATRADWPDAVGAGPLAARFGTPVLLTDGEALHPATEDALADLRPRRLTVIGAHSRVGDQVALRAQSAAGARELHRLAGASRQETAEQVSHEALRRAGAVPVAVAVNLRRPDGYAHALSASVLAGAHGALFLPVDGHRGGALTDAAYRVLRAALQKRGEQADLLGVLAGGPDLIGDGAARDLEEALRSG